MLNSADLTEFVIKPDLRETNLHKINYTIEQVQKVMAHRLKIDTLGIYYHDQPQMQNWSSMGLSTSGDMKRGSITIGPEIKNKSDFLSNDLSLSDLSKLGHEYSHLVQDDMATSENMSPGVKQILKEGASCCIEIGILNSGSLYDKVQLRDVVNHCGRIVKDKSNTFLQNSGISFDFKADESYYDGFSINRGLAHIGGIYFVGTVLGNRIDKLTMLFNNPPTLDEIVEPQKYITRMSLTGEFDPMKQIEPYIPKIIL